jgi:hypothetical protein
MTPEVAGACSRRVWPVHLTGSTKLAEARVSASAALLPSKSGASSSCQAVPYPTIRGLAAGKFLCLVKV